MDLTIALEHRFARTPDGAVWTETGLGRKAWSRYLATFDSVRILARAAEVTAPGRSWTRVDGDRVSFAPVPCYVGPLQFLRAWRAVERAVRAALAAQPQDAVILRVPGTIGSIAAGALRAAGRPFAVEVVADPFEVFAPGALDHPLRPFFRWWATRGLREVCAQSAAQLYVAQALERRYSASDGPAFVVSDAELCDEAYVSAPRTAAADRDGPFRVITVGSLEQPYKATDVLVDAVARCAAAGLDLELVVVGDGRLRGALEARARGLGLGGRVRFAGRIPSGAAVRHELDRAHLFVLPSRTEGMPRALLEAMARGLPCLGTSVGGIPDLLEARALVACEPAALATRIAEVARDAALRADLSRANLERARAFHDEVLGPVRQEFQRSLALATKRGSGALQAVPAHLVHG